MITLMDEYEKPNTQDVDEDVNENGLCNYYMKNINLFKYCILCAEQIVIDMGHKGVDECRY